MVMEISLLNCFNMVPSSPYKRNFIKLSWKTPNKCTGFLVMNTVSLIIFTFNTPVNINQLPLSLTVC